GFCISDNDKAVVAGMIQTPEVGALLTAMNEPNRAWMSARTSSAVLPDEITGVTPLVIEPGDTFATAAFAGSMKSVCMRERGDAADWSRRIASPDGLEARSVSSFATAMLATFNGSSVLRSKSKVVSGLAFPSPTQ